MNNWTPTAREALESYLEKNRAVAEGTGGDADEVVSDLRRHVEEELNLLNLSAVTEQDVNRILSRIGPIPLPVENTPIKLPQEQTWKEKSAPVRSAALFIFGILLPTVTLVFELVSHLCAGTFFDPLPTWFHVFLVALVPISNCVAWQNLARFSTSNLRWLWLTNGAAIGVSLFYAILYLPMSPFACIGIILFGFGLLPLAPLFSLICALKFRRKIKLFYAERSIKLPVGSAWWLVLPIVILSLFALPGPLTRYWIGLAQSESATESTQSIKLLRSFGSRDAILKECYGRTDQLWVEFFGGRRPNPELARKVFFRVTGEAFNSMPPPFSKYQKAGRNLFSDFEWDEGLGGETVAGQVKGLSLSGSRMDGICKAEEGWAYVEWILEFHNEHEFSQREARAQIQLPPGGVVSRLTLWVNGEEREAAFAGRSEVREAYQKVAVEQRRDPVLVTTSGPDRVLLQCFPIPPKGGSMKVRLGMTIPLAIENTNRLALRLPTFAERNFKITKGFEHNLWLESSQPISGKSKNLRWDTTNADKHGIRGQLSESDLSSSEGTLWFNTRVGTVYAVDRKSSKSAVIKQTVEPTATKFPRRIAVVLDGSKSVNSFFPQIAKSLAGIPSDPELSIYVAGDEVNNIFNSQWQSEKPASSAVSDLKGVGGQDNVSALLQAWEWATTKPDSVIVWIHGPQPILLNNIEPLKQRLDWRKAGDGPVIIDVPVKSGPDLIAEKLATTSAITALPRFGELNEDLDRLFSVWSKRRTEFRFARSIDDTPNLINEKSNSASSHVVRLWAFQEIQKLVKEKRINEAIKLAGLYQLVTPVSGAVVLETKQQFTDAGLTPADPATVPSVPEPSTWMMLMIGVIVLWFWRKRDAKNGIKNSSA